MKNEYEECSKVAVQDPLLREATNFYGDNFDKNERAIGVTFIKNKILPIIVPTVKEIINNIVLNEKIDINDVDKEENIYKILYHKNSDGKTLLELSKDILFDGQYPFPYRDVEYNFTENEKKSLTMDLLSRLIKGEIEYITVTNPAAGKQLAILENLTERFNSKTMIRNGFSCSYDIEEDLREPFSKLKQMNVIHEEGNVYKDEMKLFVLQAKYQIMLKSGRFDKTSFTIQSIEDKILELYIKHQLRMPRAERKKLEELETKITNNLSLEKRYILENTEKEKQETLRRIQKRKFIWDKYLKNRTMNSTAMPKRRFVTVAGISNPRTKLTQLEAKSRFNAYNDERILISKMQLSPKNNLYVYQRTEVGRTFSKFGEAATISEKLKEDDDTNFEIDET